MGAVIGLATGSRVVDARTCGVRREKQDAEAAAAAQEEEEEE